MFPLKNGSIADISKKSYDFECSNFFFFWKPQISSRKLGTSVDKLVEEFEAGWQPETTDYLRKLVEFCSLKALNQMCLKIGEKISDGSLSRFTYSMMLAWVMPDSADEVSYDVCLC